MLLILFIYCFPGFLRSLFSFIFLSIFKIIVFVLFVLKSLSSNSQVCVSLRFFSRDLLCSFGQFSLFICMPCNWAFEKQPHSLVLGTWLFTRQDHLLFISVKAKDLLRHFLFIHLPWAFVCGFPPIPLYPWFLLNVSVSLRVLPLLLLMTLNILLYSPLL